MSPHPTTGGKTVWTAAEPSGSEAEEEVLALRHTTGGKTVLTASSYQVEAMDEMLANEDDIQKTQKRASTGGKTLMPTVPMPLTQSTATDVEEFVEYEDNTQEFQQRASTGGKTVMPTASMPSTQSTEADADESMEDEDNVHGSMDEDDHSSESADEGTILSEDASTDIRVRRATCETLAPFTTHTDAERRQTWRRCFPAILNSRARLPFIARTRMPRTPPYTSTASEQWDFLSACATLLLSRLSPLRLHSAWQIVPSSISRCEIHGK